MTEMVSTDLDFEEIHRKSSIFQLDMKNSTRKEHKIPCGLLFFYLPLPDFIFSQIILTY